VTPGATIDEVTIRLHLEPLDEGGFVATSPDVPGLVDEGRTALETAEIAQGLARKMAESCLEHGDPLPPALVTLRTVPGPIEPVVSVGVS
jgi:antitoxin HicB